MLLYSGEYDISMLLPVKATLGRLKNLSGQSGIQTYNLWNSIAQYIMRHGLLSGIVRLITAFIDDVKFARCNNNLAAITEAKLTRITSWKKNKEALFRSQKYISISCVFV